MEGCTFCSGLGEFQAVYHTELIPICRLCSEKEGIPLVRKPTPEQIEALERPIRVRERMARLTGVQPQSSKVQEVKKIIIEKAKPEELRRLNLIDNFNWHITRARRARGLSVRQFALSLNEPLDVIERLEQGALPGHALILLQKVEQFLKIPLMEKQRMQAGIKVTGNKAELLGKEIEIIGDEE